MKNKGKGKGKAKTGEKQKGRGKGKRPKNQNEKEFEWWGVLIGIKKDKKDAVKHVIPHNSRLIEMEIKIHGPPLVLLNGYAPQSGRAIEEKEKFYEEISKRYKKLGRGK